MLFKKQPPEKEQIFTITQSEYKAPLFLSFYENLVLIHSIQYIIYFALQTMYIISCFIGTEKNPT